MNDLRAVYQVKRTKDGREFKNISIYIGDDNEPISENIYIRSGSTLEKLLKMAHIEPQIIEVE